MGDSNYAPNELKKKRILQAIVMLVVGVFFIAFPYKSLSVMVTLVGILAIVGGIAAAVIYFKSETKNPIESLNLLLGIIAIVVGIMFIARPSTLINIINIVIGLTLIAGGIMNLANTSVYHVIIGPIGIVPYVITILFGILLLVNPWGSGGTLTRVMGIFILYEGIVDIVTAAKM